MKLRRRTAYTRRVHNIQVGTLAEEIEWSKVGDAWLPSTHYFHGEIRPLPRIRELRRRAQPLFRLQAVRRRIHVHSQPETSCHNSVSRVVVKVVTWLATRHLKYSSMNAMSGIVRVVARVGPRPGARRKRSPKSKPSGNCGATRKRRANRPAAGFTALPSVWRWTTCGGTPAGYGPRRL